MVVWKKYLIDIILVITLPFWIVPLIIFGLLWGIGGFIHTCLWVGEKQYRPRVYY